MKSEYLEESARVLREIFSLIDNLKNITERYGTEPFIVEIKDSYGNVISVLKMDKEIFNAIVNNIDNNITRLEDRYKELQSR